MLSWVRFFLANWSFAAGQPAGGAVVIQDCILPGQLVMKPIRFTKSRLRERSKFRYQGIRKSKDTLAQKILEDAEG